MARDSAPDESLENAGILYVFQVFQTAQLGKSSAIRRRRFIQSLGLFRSVEGIVLLHKAVILL